MDEKTKDYLDYINLSPTSNAKDIEEYSETLEYCLKKDDILNIAVSGTYGSGKSSFIKTFFSKKEDYKTITISLGNYEKNKTKKKKNMENEYYQSIEKSILQQLLYQVDESDVPLSRFKRINKYSKRKLFLKSSIFIILFFLLLVILFPSCIDKLKNNFNVIKDFLSFVPNIKLLKINFKSNEIITIILFLCSLGFLIFTFYKIVEFLKNKISIRKFKFKDAEIEINNKSESIFNKYLDEIIYFFQSTNFNVVIIEDLDRFEDSTFIIQKLKELNQLINSSTKIDTMVKFIFAIKDDFFTDPKERTKFFDKIIPIIPISSHTNSNEIIWEKFEKIYGKKDKYGDITKKFIDDISIFVDDMRIINNIISEFIIYHDKFIKKNLDDRKLFTMIMYKNLYPKEYSELLLGNGTIPKTFKNINSNINIQLKNINGEIELLKKDKTIIQNEKLHNTSELKHALISSLVNYKESFNNQFLYFDNQRVEISEFLNDDFDINRFNNEKVTFKTNNYYGTNLDENKVFEFFDGKANFIKRLEALDKTKEKKLEELQSEIEIKDQEIKNIREKELNELISVYGISNFIDSENDFEKFTLSRGYITDDYDDYISIFKEGNLTNSDMKFIKSVKKNEKLEYSYHLEKLEEIISRLNPMDFSNINVLNIDLIDFLIKNKNRYMKELEKIILLFIQINDENYKFIEQYENIGKNFEYFAKQLIMKSSNLWQYLYDNKLGNEKYIDQWILRYLNLPNSFKNVDEQFNDYINNHKDFFKIAPKEQMLKYFESLKKLDIKFNNLDYNTDIELLNEVYKNNLYELNIHMITILLKQFNIKYDDVSQKLITTIYENSDLELMKAYIEENFSEFFNNCYLKIEKLNDIDKSLIEILNSSYTSLEEKEKIIEKEEIEFERIDLIDDSLHNLLIKNNKVKYNLNNVLELYKKSGELTVEIINIINSNKLNFDELLQVSDNEFVKQFEYDFSINNNISINIYEEIIKKLNVIDNFDNDELESNRLRILIDNDIIEFNESNYDFIKENYPDLIYKFINSHKEKFKENIENFDVSNINLLTSIEIDSNLKQYLIDEKIVNLLDLNEDDLYYLLINDIVYTDNDEVDKKVIESSLDTEKKIKYLFKNRARLEINKLLEYINLLGKYYSSIGSNWYTANIDYSSEMMALLEMLKTNNLISSYKIGKNKNIIVYNKR